ncbi:hypothetical protein CEXT_441141 [Caerostris extrusa]|uniref:Uncharacterized protein n=1 Tax=Caerostris extrusa TaxID=172846 RepID=A0AAV4XH44_CAEEX|nr:hypothetical protein CEXT_441141 [Caerostris extrusa]
MASSLAPAGVPYEDEEDSKQGVSSFVNQGSDKRNPPENSADDSAIPVAHEENSNRQPNVDDDVPPPACTEFPKWTAPNLQNVEVRGIGPLDSVYTTDLYISNIREEHNGQYECYRCSFQKKVFNIQVKGMFVFVS